MASGALQAVEGENLAVPAHLRNAPTAFMRQQGYGKGYAYYFDDPAGSFEQRYLPEGAELRLYTPRNEGWEGRASERWRKLMALHGAGGADAPGVESEADNEVVEPS